MTDAEKINALLKKLETGATCQSDAMRAFDVVKTAAIDHPQSSISRDIFERFIDDISDEIEALKSQDKPVEVTEDVLYAEWFEDDEDQELDFYEWVFKKKLPNGLKIIEGARDGNTETAT